MKIGQECNAQRQTPGAKEGQRARGSRLARIVLALAICALLYLLLHSLTGGWLYYMLLGPIGGGILARGLAALPVFLSACALAMVAACGFLYHTQRLSREGFYVLVVPATLVCFSATLLYYAWSRRALGAFAGDRLVFEDPVVDTADVFHALGGDASACFLTNDAGKDVLYVLGRVDGLDPARSERVLRTLEAKGFRVRRAERGEVRWPGALPRAVPTDPCVGD